MDMVCLNLGDTVPPNVLIMVWGNGEIKDNSNKDQDKIIIINNNCTVDLYLADRVIFRGKCCKSSRTMKQMENAECDLCEAIIGYMKKWKNMQSNERRKKTQICWATVFQQCSKTLQTHTNPMFMLYHVVGYSVWLYMIHSRRMGRLAWIDNTSECLAAVMLTRDWSLHFTWFTENLLNFTYRLCKHNESMTWFEQQLRTTTIMLL